MALDSAVLALKKLKDAIPAPVFPQRYVDCTEVSDGLSSACDLNTRAEENTVGAEQNIPSEAAVPQSH